MKNKITLMTGAGNIFTVIDLRRQPMSGEQLAKAASALCSTGICSMETEGLLAISEGTGSSHFNAQFFNPDGSSGMMCANGGRCAVNFAVMKGIATPKPDGGVTFSLGGISYSAYLIDDDVRLILPPAQKIVRDVKVDIEFNENEINKENRTICGTFVDVHSDHFVVHVEETGSMKSLAALDLDGFALPIRHHETFAPYGVNVDVYEMLGDNRIFLRTFERGVERETGACGTGAISTAIAVALQREVVFPVKVYPTSGIPLIVDIEGVFPDYVKNIVIQGPAEIIKECDVEINN